MNKAITPDKTRNLTLEEARALPGLLGKVAPASLAFRGHYGYTDAETGETVLLRLCLRHGARFDSVLIDGATIMVEKGSN